MPPVVLKGKCRLDASGVEERGWPVSTRMKRRMVVVSGIIAVVLLIVLGVVGGNASAKTVSVAEAAEGGLNGQKIQVSGNVVPGSYSTEGDRLNFAIYDPEVPSVQVKVAYDGAASSTFGNDVTAICTGRTGADGVLQCTELVTKCPSKYESGTDALAVSRLIGYGESMAGTTVKLVGIVKENTLQPAGSIERFVLADPDTGDAISVLYAGALSDAIGDGSRVVLTGSLDEQGAFDATAVSLEG